MDNIFDNIDENLLHDSPCEEMTPEEFVVKAKSLLQAMLDFYSASMETEHDPENPESTCDRCHGMLYIEQGGETVDCPNCYGTGYKINRSLNPELFSEKIEQDVIFGNQPFFELLNCKIKPSGGVNNLNK